jgi:YD repeat-containing protein
MKILISVACLLNTFIALPQYYYKDIITILETNRQMQAYRLNNVQRVTATGFDAKGAKDPVFSEVQEILSPGTTLKITTRNNPENLSILYLQFDKDARITQLTDSSSGILVHTTYTYDQEGRITEIANTTIDPLQDFNMKEVHQWFYNPLSPSLSPVKMLRIRNDIDSTEIRFNFDEHGNVIDEQPFKNNRPGEMIYYYYDVENRLTDIVRYNNKARRLLPDYLFEYDDDDRVIQKITTVPDPDIGYVLWRYAFDDKGLKTKEAMFNKYKQMTGKIEYTYTFTR